MGRSQYLCLALCPQFFTFLSEWGGEVAYPEELPPNGFGSRGESLWNLAKFELGLREGLPYVEED
ncbi:MAG: hypothetical protein K0U52_03985, partial [Gammaproteobacteria bacterium]|nr:hypothetical protein [Gammaproteobacteria bacterium]